jgi:plasmid maintenance system antidote protein VapI
VNIEPMLRARRWPSPAAKLTPDQVAEIRREAARRADSQRDLANVYGVHEATISRLLTGKSWRTEAAR